MDRDPFGHRKYHGLYFILGFLIAVVLVLMMGCEQATSTAGVDVEVNRCPVGWEGPCDDVIIYPPPPPVCCMALIPQCMACADRCSVGEWLERTCGPNATDAEYAGWDEDENEPIWLCQAEIID